MKSWKKNKRFRKKKAYKSLSVLKIELPFYIKRFLKQESQRLNKSISSILSVAIEDRLKEINYVQDNKSKIS